VNDLELLGILIQKRKKKEGILNQYQPRRIMLAFVESN